MPWRTNTSDTLSAEQEAAMDAAFASVAKPLTPEQVAAYDRLTARTLLANARRELPTVQIRLRREREHEARFGGSQAARWAEKERALLETIAAQEAALTPARRVESAMLAYAGRRDMRQALAEITRVSADLARGVA